MVLPHCTVKEAVVVTVLPREPKEDVIKHLIFKKMEDDHGTSVVIVGDRLNIEHREDGQQHVEAKEQGSGMEVQWAHNCLYHLFKTRSWIFCGNAMTWLSTPSWKTTIVVSWQTREQPMEDCKH